MGRGDRKTAKGKRFAGSYGNVRPKSPVAAKTVAVKAPVRKSASKTASKAPAKAAKATKTAKKSA